MTVNNSHIGSTMLEDADTRMLLKQLVLEKEERYREVKRLRVAYLESDEFGDLSEDFRPFFLEQVFDHCREGKELPVIERDLTNMCLALTKKEPKLGPKVSRRWEQAYQRATEGVAIADVVQYLLGTDNLRRNIPCPFHEDRTPSLKVYEGNNRFLCFGCGVTGSPIDFVMQYQSCSFKEAVYFLNNTFF